MSSRPASPAPRLKRVLTSLLHHRHAFVKDIELTEEEWAQAIAFLTATGAAQPVPRRPLRDHVARELRHERNRHGR
jgi:hypothetical protein